MLSAFPASIPLVFTSSLSATVIQAPQSRFLEILPTLFPAVSRMLSSTAAVAAPVPTLVAPQPAHQLRPTSHARALGTTLAHRPAFHLAPLHRGWANDPNGVHYCPTTKLYHMMYQHHPTSSVWSWGLSWGHATSTDLLTWHHLDPILSPTPGGPDADGVWSGCAFPVPETGETVILNTACRLRAHTPVADLPPASLDLGLQMIESQAAATARPGSDPLLKQWTKASQPLLPLPPSGNLTGWRDPFLVGRPGDGLHDKWTLLIGAGYKAGTHGAPPAHGVGTALLYTSDTPTRGWTYTGELCRGDGTNGTMFECPLLARLPTREAHPCPHSPPSHHSRAAVGAEPGSHVFVVCPDNAHHAPIYYVGDYSPAEPFELSAAKGGRPLDLGGSTFYAPNVLTNDPHGRLVMWGWVQELGRPEGPHTYGSCLSLPRLLWRNPSDPNRVWQEPLPKLRELRQEGGSWSPSEPHIRLLPGKPLTLPTHVGGARQVEVEVTLTPPTHFVAGRVAKSALLLRSHSGGVRAACGEASGRHGAALLYDWRTHTLSLVYSDGSLSVEELARLPASAYRAMNSAAHVEVAGSSAGGASGGTECGASPDWLEELPGSCGGSSHTAGDGCDGAPVEEEVTEDIEAGRAGLSVHGCHSVGGRLHHPTFNGTYPLRTARGLQPLTLRIFIDYSLLEVFTSTGEVLTARVYREYEAQTAGEPASDTPTHNAASIQLASYGVASGVSGLAAHVLRPIWASDEDTAALEDGLREQLGCTLRHTATRPVPAAPPCAVPPLAGVSHADEGAHVCPVPVVTAAGDALCSLDGERESHGPHRTSHAPAATSSGSCGVEARVVYEMEEGEASIMACVA